MYIFKCPSAQLNIARLTAHKCTNRCTNLTVPVKKSDDIKSLLPWHRFGYHIGQLEGGRFLAYYITRVDFFLKKVCFDAAGPDCNDYFSRNEFTPGRNRDLNDSSGGAKESKRETTSNRREY